MGKLKVLCLHGVGHHPPGGPWETAWQVATQNALDQVDPGSNPDIRFMHYDDLFANYTISFADSLEAVGKLASSAVTSPFRGAPGLSGTLRWTAGMVVQWVENRELREDLRGRLVSAIQSFKPDVILAHSLGSLICYHTFSAAGHSDTVKNRTFISCGSQIGNPFVSGNYLAGRVTPLTQARFWFHLFNPADDVFTARINLNAVNFRQVLTDFDNPGFLDHNAASYIAHRNTIREVWGDVVLTQRQPKLFRVPKRLPKRIHWAARPSERALLVGINEYPDEGMRLEGCVNDVFLMSSLLQDAGFDPANIRAVLDDRATANGIRDRLTWLLDGAQEGDVRVFYFSGHGAQIPSYGLGEQVDRFDEALVPWDFDWSREKAIIDDWFYECYSQLPYGLKFIVIFDCCHSGGLTRGPGTQRIRGINPPDDIRHRQLRWNSDQQMWAQRPLKSSVGVYGVSVKAQKNPVGERRLGHANPLRTLPKAAFDARRQDLQHNGPYMPALIYACREDEFAYEYRHGSTSYGAFTFTLCQTLGEHRRRQQSVTFAGLVGAVEDKLKTLRYDQHPQTAGPAQVLNSDIPLGI
jgi:hypothetical protein